MRINFPSRCRLGSWLIHPHRCSSVCIPPVSASAFESKAHPYLSGPWTWCSVGCTGAPWHLVDGPNHHPVMGCVSVSFFPVFSFGALTLSLEGVVGEDKSGHPFTPSSALGPPGESCGADTQHQFPSATETSIAACLPKAIPSCFPSLKFISTSPKGHPLYHCFPSPDGVLLLPYLCQLCVTFLLLGSFRNSLHVVTQVSLCLRHYLAMSVTGVPTPTSYHWPVLQESPQPCHMSLRLCYGVTTATSQGTTLKLGVPTATSGITVSVIQASPQLHHKSHICAYVCDTGIPTATSGLTVSVIQASAQLRHTSLCL